MAKVTRFPVRLWNDPDWTSLTAPAQLFAMACLMFGKTGPCTDARVARKTGWTRETITACRAEVEASPFGYMLVGLETRRPMPREVARAVKDRDGNVCVYCGATERLEIDHIYPVKLGGSDDMWNLQTLCSTCNRRKGAKVIENPRNQARVLAI